MPSFVRHKVLQSDPSILYKSIVHYITKNNKHISTMFNYPDVFVSTSKIDEYAYTIYDDRADLCFGDFLLNIDTYISNLEIYDDIRITVGQDLENTQYLNMFVHSSKHDMSYIEKFMNMCEAEYRVYQSISIQNNILTEYTFDKTLNYFQCYQYPFSTTKTLDSVFFKQKDEFTKKFNFFINNEDLYKRIGKPHTFGVMLYGPSGCGKTSFIKAMLKSTDRCGVKIELSSDVNLRQLQNTIISDNVGGEIIPHNRRILIFEDIDCMKDIVRSGELKNNNLSKILNMFDGLVESNGRICIFTTNRVDYLDDAMIRPGRVDCLIRFTKCTKHMIVDIINHFYDSTDITLEHVKDYIDESISPAEIDSICFKHEDKWKAIEEILYISSNIKLGGSTNIYDANTENKSESYNKKKYMTSKPVSDAIYKNKRINTSPSSESESDIKLDAIYKNKMINTSPSSESESDTKSDAIYKNKEMCENPTSESECESDSSESYNNGMNLITEAVMTVNKYKNHRPY